MSTGRATQATSWPLVARDEELALLESVVAAAEATRSDEAAVSVGPGRPAGVIVFGTSGVGKSRLVREVVDRCAARGSATAWVMGTHAGRAVPYGAFAHLAPAQLPTSGDDDRFAFHHAFTEELQRRAAGRPLVIGVDDAHLLDPAGALLLSHLVLTGSAILLATIREGESVPDPITALWRNGLVDRLDLQRLSRTDIAELAGVALGGEVGRPTVRRLAELSSGNVLFARELILAGCASGALRQIDGVWRWHGNVPADSRLAELVGARMAELDDSRRDALGLVVIGEPLPTGLVDALVEPEVVVDLERRGLVTVVDDEGETRVRMGHPLYGEVIAASLGAAERRRLARMLADAADAQRVGPERFDEGLRAVLWRLDADDHADPELLTQAARRANSLFDYPLAERVSRTVLDDRGSIHAALVLAEALSNQNRFAEADELLDEWEAVALDDDSVEVGNSYLAQRFTSLFNGLGRDAEAMAALDRFTVAHRSAPWQDRADAYRVKILVDLGRLGEALEIGVPLVTRDDGDEDAVLICVDSVSRALCYVGRTTTAVDALDRAREPAERRAADFPRASAWIAAHDVMALFLDGRLADAVSLIEPFYEPIVRSGDDNARGVIALVIGRVEVMQGRFASARRWMLEAVDAMRVSDSAGYLPWAHAILAQAEAMLGDPAAARRSLAAGRDAARLSTALLEIDFVLGEALATWAEGRLQDAVEVALTGAEGLREQPAMEALALHTALRLGAVPGRVLTRAEELAAASESALPHRFAEHARALQERDGAALERLAAAFDELGSPLLAAEAAAQASLAHREAAVPAAAKRTATLSRRLAGEVDGRPTPALAGAEEPTSLSRREREVAGLAADGLSNQAIAERLSLSVRTVESHLHQAFAKLGVDRRDQLGDLLGR